MWHLRSLRLLDSGIILGAALIMAVAVHAQAPVKGNPAARKLKNPVPATAASIEAGSKTFTTFCVLCHGPAGKGNGPMVLPGTPPPSDLTDEKWTHGSTDGEIFDVISNGTNPVTTMAAFKVSLAEKDIWNLVNYIRSLGPKTETR